MMPPNVPANSIYTKNWCEENIYLLCQNLLEDDGIVKSWEASVIVISNHSKTVALWNQKAAHQEGSLVVWDYHVILVLRARKSSDAFNDAHDATLPISDQTLATDCWVYDFDSTLHMPCAWEDYIAATFPANLRPQYQSLFRVVPGTTFLDYFASDRSHMLVKDAMVDSHDETITQLYHSPPPPYGPLRGKAVSELGISNNLMAKFVGMVPSKESYGEVLTLEEVAVFFMS